ncbi:organic cation transporter protein isoform X2 [Procambarus clarkii]|uniref:organic cation transporter protein isoform X2 n=1 Tax=Procambarus clarkii TaxID=6728 RepID=UPI003743B402
MSPVPERSRRDSKTLTVGYGTTSDQHLEPVITFDEVLEKLGMGRWNLPVILGLSFWTMNMSPHVLGGVFMAPNIDVTCQVPEGGFPKVLQQEGTNQTRLDHCVYVEEMQSGSMVDRPCELWAFDNSTFHSTVTSEFQLVCDSRAWRTTFQSIYTVGLLFGSSVNGFFCDRYGRKTMLIISTVMYCLLALGISWLPDLSTILIARFILGIMHPITNHCGHTLAMEITPKRHRRIVGPLYFLPWSVGVAAWGGFAYFIRDWRWLQLVSSLPTLLYFPSLWVTDESPRWLMVRGHHDRALQVLEKAARWNNVQLPPRDQLLAMMEDISSEAARVSGEATARVSGEATTRVSGEATAKRRTPGRQTWLTKLSGVTTSFTILFRTRRMRRTTLGMYGCHLVLGLAFYGISLSGQTLGADLFSFMALAGAAEVLAKFLAAVSIERFGRKIISTVSFSTTGVAMLAAAFVPADLVWLVTTLSLAGKLTISMCYTTVFLMTSELFPTEVRTRGLGTSTVMAQIGSISAAYLVDYLGKLASWAPSAVFGVTSLLAAGITRSFRETRGAALIDTVSALETQVFKPHALDASALKTHAADTQVQTEE